MVRTWSRKDMDYNNSKVKMKKNIFVIDSKIIKRIRFAASKFDRLVRDVENWGSLHALPGCPHLSVDFHLLFDLSIQPHKFAHLFGIQNS